MRSAASAGIACAADPDGTAAPRFEVLREVLAERDGDEEWEARLSRELAAAALRCVADVEPDEDLRRLAAEASAGAVRLVVAMVREDMDPAGAQPPAATVEFAREVALRGEPIDHVIRAYHVAHARFFELWALELRASGADPGRVGMAIEQGAAWTFEFVDALGREIAGRLADDGERHVRSAAALRLEEVRAVLAGSQSDGPLASARLGYELSLRHRALVLWTPRPGIEQTAELERSARALLVALGASSGLVVPLPGGIVAAWSPAGTCAEAEVRRALERAGAPVAAGTPQRGIEGFRLSHEEALAARRIACLSGDGGRATLYRDVAMLDLATADLARARRFVAAELGVLAAPDPASRRLARTLCAYLEHRGSSRRAAEELGVHENTVANRVHAACELLGHGVEERMPEVLLALRLSGVVDAGEGDLGPVH